MVATLWHYGLMYLRSSCPIQLKAILSIIATTHYANSPRLASR